LAGADIPDPLRVTALVDPADGEALAGRLQQQFGDQLELHAIRAPNYGVTVIEAFAAGASKASALKYVAQGYRLAASKVLAVGDDVNDIPMLRWAGAGLAMPDASAAVRDAADGVVAGSLAEVIEKLADDPRPEAIVAALSAHESS
jgi:hydroxymethylpyrimidine pyrophosphatase-like HAD family hydrolase